jgi:hypothetical protein
VHARVARENLNFTFGGSQLLVSQGTKLWLVQFGGKCCPGIVHLLSMPQPTESRQTKQQEQSCQKPWDSRSLEHSQAPCIKVAVMILQAVAPDLRVRIESASAGNGGRRRWLGDREESEFFHPQADVLTMTATA